jgi:hypothetical protein
MERLFGLYKGVVIFDSDTSSPVNYNAQGRVKVKIEGVTFVNNSNEGFRFPRGSNIEGGISTPNLELIDTYETWAYVSMAVLGESSMGKYNAARDRASTTDSSNMDTFGDATDSGAPPAAQFGIHAVSDGFSGAPNILGTRGINTYSRTYFCDNRSNLSKGMFAIPTVGTHVIIQFLYGNRSYPIITGVLQSADDINRMYSVDGNIKPSYPGAFSVNSEPPPLA